MEQTPNTGEILQSLFDSYGGDKNFFAEMESSFNKFLAIWNQDSEAIGRVLRSHLAVEHFMTQFLVHTNKSLGSIEKARLTYAQKVEILPDDQPVVSEIKPGIRLLNKIRNRIAHNLQARITEEDKMMFLSIKLFTIFRNASDKTVGERDCTPLSVLEEFSIFATRMFSALTDPNKDFWTRAISGKK